MKKNWLTIFFVGITLLANAQSDETTLKDALTLSDKGYYAQSNEKLITLYNKNYLPDLVAYNIASNYYMLKDYKTAQKYAYNVINSNSQYSLQASVVLGNCLNKRKKYAEEEQLYLQTAKKYEDNFIPHYCLGNCYISQNKYENACIEFENAIQLKPLDANCHFMLAETMYDREYYVHSLLADYFYLLAEQKGNRRLIIICKMFKTMNITDIDQIIARKTAKAENLSQEDVELISTMMFINQLDKKDFDNQTHLPPAETFVKNSREIIKSICNSTTYSSGFFTKTYINFYKKLIEDNQLEAFLYCITRALEPDSSLFPTLTKQDILNFADWLENYFNQQ